MDNRKPHPKKSICDSCNSCAYCINKAPGVTGCINFNKFPKKDKITHY